MKLKFGELNARMLCQYTAFAEVVGGIFGSKKAETGPVSGEYEDIAQGASFEAALANINNALRVG